LLGVLVTSTTLFFVLVLLSARGRRLSLAHPLTLYFMYHAIAALAYGWYLELTANVGYFARFMGRYAAESERIKAIFMLDAGLLAFWIGYEFLGARRLAGRLRASPARIRGRRAIILGSILLVPAVWAAWRYHPRYIGSRWGQAEIAYRGRVVIRTGATGYLTGAPRVLPAIAVLWAALYGFRPSIVALLGCYVGYRVWAGWARGRVVQTLLACLFVQLRRRRSRWPKARWVLPMLLFAVPALIAQQDRAFFGKCLAGEERLFQGGARLLGRAEWEANLRWHERVALVGSVVPHRTGYTYGTQYLWAFLWPIPRSLWPNKPVRTSIVDLAMYANVRGMGIPAPAEAYMSFGWLSLFLQMLLSGTAFAFLHQVYRRNQENHWIAVPYLLFLSNFSAFLNAGPVGVLPAILFWVMPTLAVAYFSGRGCVRPAGSGAADPRRASGARGEQRANV